MKVDIRIFQAKSGQRRSKQADSASFKYLDADNFRNIRCKKFFLYNTLSILCRPETNQLYETSFCNYSAYLRSIFLDKILSL